MFAPSQSDVRRFFCDAWRKQRDGVPMTPLETLAADWIAQHPEYHADLADVDAALAADDAFHGVFVAASANAELPRALDRLMPRIRRLERARFGSLQGRRSVAQHDAIVQIAGTGDAKETADLVRENWLSLGALIDRTFNEEGT
jgi:DNA-binding GntR family transcriptional regulator